MNRVELKKKLDSVMSQLLSEKKVISPLDVLLGVGILSAKDLEDWRFGRVPYLEKVCRANLSVMTFIMKEIKNYADGAGLKPSHTGYVRWGTKGKKVPLRFSKSGDAKIEAAYATHYVVRTQRNVDGE
ncbi:hypothetical protein [Acidaminobacter sp.]|uniref:hypothetical protein n=1 Tax=Acidaminobacter sp. TaxID=1872102 RepID=UPI002567374B|nr:hypothetical protein [Acidaminobacter sp.]MDK9712347.1 hypothetical protein [Acidaminobacter sp.]